MHIFMTVPILLHPDLHGSDSARDGADDAQAILQVLEKTHWNRTDAARLLGISRMSLYRKMKAYTIQ